MAFNQRSGIGAGKRIFDVATITLLVWLWLPIVTVSALLNWALQGRPVFYTSIRRVYKNQSVRMIKFRTMVRNAVQIANRSTIPITGKCFLNIPEDSELYTPFGRFLEKYHFTELPQFFQVASGKMSVVGNRPLPEDVCQALMERFHYASGRFDVRCGMVGPVQLVGRDFLSDEERLQVEIAYARACRLAYSWQLDVVVLASMLMIALRILPSWTPDQVLALISLHSGISRDELTGEESIESSAADHPPVRVDEDSAPPVMAETGAFTPQTLATVYPRVRAELTGVPVVILCGGKGTRAYPYTRDIPKALLEVDGRPIVERVMDVFADQGHNDFVLSLGHLKETVIDHFGKQKCVPGAGRIRMHDTGEASDTGDRILHCRPLLGNRFIATYADGICDVSLDKLIEFHDLHEGLVTITCVPLQSQFGTIEADERGKVSRFREKPILSSHWINAGFIVFESEAFEYWQGKNLEQDVLPSLAEKGLLYCYQHSGFFKSMDTHKDQLELSKLFASRKVPAPHRMMANERLMAYSEDEVST
ncbi:MAG: sugar transferase [Planctomycetaceae bacterium]|nr:sugar transferase [Planctomycetaceae bacterium]